MKLARPKNLNGRKPILTPQQIVALRQIKAQRDALPTNSQLAQLYGVHKATIADAMNPARHGWMHSAQAQQQEGTR
jgi:hypothetical protein